MLFCEQIHFISHPIWLDCLVRGHLRGRDENEIRWLLQSSDDLWEGIARWKGQKVMSTQLSLLWEISKSALDSLLRERSKFHHLFFSEFYLLKFLPFQVSTWNCTFEFLLAYACTEKNLNCWIMNEIRNWLFII